LNLLHKVKFDKTFDLCALQILEVLLPLPLNTPLIQYFLSPAPNQDAFSPLRPSLVTVRVIGQGYGLDKRLSRSSLSGVRDSGSTGVAPAQPERESEGCGADHAI